MKKNILLLTSTIRPKPNQPQLSLVNTEERLKDYASAMEFYAQQLYMGRIDKIVFVDNSGFDLSSLSDRYQSEHIEWISYYGLDYPNGYHRGYGEFKLIDYAYTHSNILSTLSDTDIVWKITGRYKVLNIANIIRLAPSHFDMYCDIQNNWIDMSLMAWNKTGYGALIHGICQRFATGMAPELIMANSIKNSSGGTIKIIMSYYWLPYILGRRGYDGSKFIGRFTPFKHGLIQAYKLATLPVRYMVNLI